MPHREPVRVTLSYIGGPCKPHEQHGDPALLLVQTANRPNPAPTRPGIASECAPSGLGQLSELPAIETSLHHKLGNYAELDLSFWDRRGPGRQFEVARSCTRMSSS